MLSEMAQREYANDDMQRYFSLDTEFIDIQQMKRPSAVLDQQEGDMKQRLEAGEKFIKPLISDPKLHVQATAVFIAHDMAEGKAIKIQEAINSTEQDGKVKEKIKSLRQMLQMEHAESKVARDQYHRI